MIFNNFKLVIVLILIGIIFYMVTNKEIPNDGEIEGLNDNEVEEIEQQSEEPALQETEVEETENVEDELNEETNNVDNIEDNLNSDEEMLDSVMNNEIKPNDLNQDNSANFNENNTSVTAKNMKKLMEENEKKKLEFNASEYLPKDVNNDWFETDLNNDEVNVKDSNLIVTDRYIVGVNTVGQSLKNASYDIRAAPPCPKFAVSPWQQSTIEPDFNIKSLTD